MRGVPCLDNPNPSVETWRIREALLGKFDMVSLRIVSSIRGISGGIACAI